MVPLEPVKCQVNQMFEVVPLEPVKCLKMNPIRRGAISMSQSAAGSQTLNENSMTTNSDDNRVIGKLTGMTEIELHSYQTVTTLKGRKVEGKPNISGFNSFSNRFHVIYSAAQVADPFANYALLMVEEMISELDDHIRDATDHIARIKATVPEGVKHEDPENENPQTFRLPASHYGSMVLSRIASMDKIVLDYVGLMHHNLLSQKIGNTAIRAMSKKMRKLMECCTHYKFTGVTISHLKQRTQLAQQAIEKQKESGFINQSVLTSDEAIYKFFIQNYSSMKPDFGPDVAIETDESVTDDDIDPQKVVTVKPTVTASKGPFKGKASPNNVSDIKAKNADAKDSEEG